MEIPDKLRCLFAADVEETRGTYQIAVPKRDVEFGTLSAVVFSYAIASPKTAPVGMDGAALSAKSTSAQLSSANQNATRSGEDARRKPRGVHGGCSAVSSGEICSPGDFAASARANGREAPVSRDHRSEPGETGGLAGNRRLAAGDEASDEDRPPRGRSPLVIAGVVRQTARTRRVLAASRKTRSVFRTTASASSRAGGGFQGRLTTSPTDFTPH